MTGCNAPKGGCPKKTSLFSVNKNICVECSLALRRFIGGLDGVASFEIDQLGDTSTLADLSVVDSLVKGKL